MTDSSKTPILPTKASKIIYVICTMSEDRMITAHMAVWLFEHVETYVVRILKLTMADVLILRVPISKLLPVISSYCKSVGLQLATGDEALLLAASKMGKVCGAAVRRNGVPGLDNLEGKPSDSLPGLGDLLMMTTLYGASMATTDPIIEMFEAMWVNGFDPAGDGRLRPVVDTAPEAITAEIDSAVLKV